MKIRLIAAGVAVFLVSFAVQAQPPILPDSPLQNTAPPTPVGSGARAMGTGGAFIAIADDATAANWNPGGLVQLLLPEMSLVMTREQKDIDGDEVTFQNINYLSAVYPFSVSDINMVTSLNYQRLYDFYFDGRFDTPIKRTSLYSEMVNYVPGGPSLINHYSLTYNERKKGFTKIEGDLGAVSPAFAIQITPAFSIGFTYNYWEDGIVGPDYRYHYYHVRNGTVSYDQADWVDPDETGPSGPCTCNGGQVCDTSPGAPPQIIDNPDCYLEDGFTIASSAGSIDYNSENEVEEDVSFQGENFNVGLLWKASPRITLGAVYRSEFTADLERKQRIFTTSGGVVRDKIEESMTFPASYGAGVAFRYSDALSFAADITRIEWNRFLLESEDHVKISPVNGLPEKEADIDPTITYRAGVEYLVIRPKFVVPIRGGFFYDPEPARGGQDEYYGVSVGTGIVYDRMVLDISYWYRWGQDVIISTSVDQDPNTGKILSIKEDKGDISRQMLMLSAVLHLK